MGVTIMSCRFPLKFYFQISWIAENVSMIHICIYDNLEFC